MLLGILLGSVALVLALALTHPFRIWGQVGWIGHALITQHGLRPSVRLRLARRLLQDVLVALLLTVPATIDRLFFAGWKKQTMPAPVYVVGQPRSGTTFFHRTLADSLAFTTIPHLHWRYPFVCVWWAVHKLGLYDRVAARNYWPNTAQGAMAERLHQNRLGDVEEHGVFLEERWFHHYFLTRRYPMPEAFAHLAYYDRLSAPQKDRIAASVLEVVHKYQWFYGTSAPWLTKENESVEIYRRLIAMTPGCKVIFLLRDPRDSIPSYVKLSVTSTRAKTEVDPRGLAGWDSMNIRFRRHEMTDMIRLSHELMDSSDVAHVTYDRLVGDIPGTITDVAENLDLQLDPEYLRSLRDLQARQRVRVKGYENDLKDHVPWAEFDEFGRFVGSFRPEDHKL